MEHDTHPQITEPRHHKAARLFLYGYLRVLMILLAIMAVTATLAWWLASLAGDTQFSLHSDTYQKWVRVGSGLLGAATVIFGMGAGEVAIGTIAALYNWRSVRKTPDNKSA